MSNNQISVRAYLVDGSTLDILEDASPKDAIENYFCPDMRPPVQTIVITTKTDDGKIITLSISPNFINVKVA